MTALELLSDFVKDWRKEDGEWKSAATDAWQKLDRRVLLIETRNRSTDDSVRKDGVSRRVKWGLIAALIPGTLGACAQLIGALHLFG